VAAAKSEMKFQRGSCMRARVGRGNEAAATLPQICSTTKDGPLLEAVFGPKVPHLVVFMEHAPKWRSC
jgi:hypothetical protein